MSAVSCRNSYCSGTFWGAAVPGVSSHHPQCGVTPTGAGVGHRAPSQAPGRGCTRLGTGSQGQVKGSLSSSHAGPACPHTSMKQCGCQQGAARAPPWLTSSRSKRQQCWGAPHAATACEGLSSAVGACEWLQLQSPRLLRKGKRQLRQFNKCSTRKDSILEALTLHTSHLRSPPSCSSRGLATALSDSPGLGSHSTEPSHRQGHPEPRARWRAAPPSPPTPTHPLLEGALK